MAMMYAGPERRLTKRLSVNYGLSYQMQRSAEGYPLTQVRRDYAGFVVDLSCNGIGVSVRDDILPASKLRLRFTLINPHRMLASRYRLIEAEGSVCYNVCLEKKSYRLGICFTDIDREEKRSIADLVSREYV